MQQIPEFPVEILVVVNAVFFLVAVAAAAFLFYGPWQRLCADVYRQRAFEARDALFDMALSGKLSFDSDDYRVMRRSLEATIRFAHRITIPYLFVMIIEISRKSNRLEQRSRLAMAITRIESIETREEVEKIVSNVHRAFFEMLVHRSVVMLFLLAIFKTFGWLRLRRFAINIKKRGVDLAVVKSEDHDGLAPA